MLHGEAILRGHVYCLPWHAAELQPLDEDGEEEEDLRPGDEFAHTAAFAQTEDHDLLAFHLVELGAIGTQETIRVENGGLLPCFAVE